MGGRDIRHWVRRTLKERKVNNISYPLSLSLFLSQLFYCWVGYFIFMFLIRYEWCVCGWSLGPGGVGGGVQYLIGHFSALASMMVETVLRRVGGLVLTMSTHEFLCGIFAGWIVK